MRPAIPRASPPPYPKTADAFAYAEHYRVNVLAKTGNLKGFATHDPNRFIQVKTTGGLDNYFIVQAYAPGGFWYADPRELDKIELRRAWILLYLPRQHTYQVIIQTTHHGYTRFLEAKRQIGL